MDFKEISDVCRLINYKNQIKGEVNKMNEKLSLLQLSTGKGADIQREEINKKKGYYELLIGDLDTHIFLAIKNIVK